MPEPTARALYLTRQHYRKIVLEGVDNNIFSTYHPIPDIKEKDTQIQYNNNNKIYNVTWVKVFCILTDFSFCGKS